jgi:AcrR family transcriptional regulator
MEIQMEYPPADTRTTLLHAALACFAEHGFDGTSIRMIANLSQRPLSLLAHHFGNKEGLYLEVFKFIFENSISKNLDNPIPEDGYSPRDKDEAIRMLREQIHYLLKDVLLKSSNTDPIQENATRLWLQEIRSPRPILFPILSSYMKPYTETVKKCIQTLRPELSEAEVIFLGVSILGQIAGHGLMRGLNQAVWGRIVLTDNQFQAAEWLVDLCLNGLVGGPGRHHESHPQGGIEGGPGNPTSGRPRP